MNTRYSVGGNVWFDVIDDPYQATAWDILNDNPQDTAWDILNHNIQPIAWDVLNQINRDIAWDMLNANFQDTAWDILNQNIRSIAWDTLNQFNRDISWDILNTNFRSSAWDILNDGPRDIAWDILNASSPVPTAWDILNSTYCPPTIYENAENGNTLGWDVYDSDPPGATITNVADTERGDGNTRAIEVSGDGTNNGYRFRLDSGSAWNNTTQTIVKWSMKFSETFTVYMDCETTLGHRFIMFVNGVGPTTVNGQYVSIKLGSGTYDGTWKHFEIDIAPELELVEPGNVILSINGFWNRGSGIFDNISLGCPGNISWDISNQIDRNTAWDILNSNSRNVAWDILNDSPRSIAWDILNHNSRDIAWDILNENTRDIAWDILNTNIRDVAWDILNEKVDSIAWDILNSRDTDTTWAILNTNAREIAWDIINDNPQAFSWSVFARVLYFIQQFFIKSICFNYNISEPQMFNKQIVQPVPFTFKSTGTINDTIHLHGEVFDTITISTPTTFNFQIKKPVQFTFNLTEILEGEQVEYPPA
jgi:hypothetical protein